MRFFFQCIAEAVLENGIKGLAQMVPGGPFAYDVAESAYKKIVEKKQREQYRNELKKMAEAKLIEAKREAASVARQVIALESTSVRNSPTPTKDQIVDLELFLTAIPNSARQSFRRPEDVTGKTVPSDFAIHGPQDVLRLLPTRPPRFRPGAEVPGKRDWKLEHSLGVGGFGEVWLARHCQYTALSGAIKFCFDQTGRELIHEADLINRVLLAGTHPNIVPLRDVCLSGETPWLQFDYIAGGDLTGWIHSLATMSTEQRIRQVYLALKQLTKAVGHFHSLEKPIVHRDLKPSNILWDPEIRKLRITDFGIGSVTARATNLLENSGHSIGGGHLISCLRGSHTPIYSSPQQRRAAAPDPRDDVHALGVIAYQMLTGKLDIGPGTGAKRALKQVGTPKGLIDLILDCSSEEADDRPKNAIEFLDSLSHSMDKEQYSGSKQFRQVIEAQGELSQTEFDVEIPGSWWSRPINIPEAEWVPICDTPSRIVTQVGEEYQLILVSTVTDDELKKLKNIENLRDIVFLGLRDCKQVSDAGLEFVSGLSSLHYLDMKGCTKISDVGLKVLSKLNELIFLNLSFCDSISDDGLRWLSSFRKLDTLDIGSCKLITDTGLKHIGEILLLKKLYAPHCCNFSDVGLSYLTKLRHLNTLALHYCPKITDEGLMHLSKLKNLESLRLVDCDEISDDGLGSLKTLSLLSYISLSGCCSITGLGFRHLASSGAVKYLDLCGCDSINDKGLINLTHLAQLKWLWLSVCKKITDIGLESLSKMKQLEMLDLRGLNRITDVGLASISNLIRLSSLDLSECDAITDAGLFYLAKLTQLKFLNISHCKNITDAGIGGLQRKLENCKISAQY